MDEKCEIFILACQDSLHYTSTTSIPAFSKFLTREAVVSTLTPSSDRVLGVADDRTMTGGRDCCVDLIFEAAAFSIAARVAVAPAKAAALATASMSFGSSTSTSTHAVCPLHAPPRGPLSVAAPLRLCCEGGGLLCCPLEERPRSVAAPPRRLCFS